jgi:hypothetical protein
LSFVFYPSDAGAVKKFGVSLKQHLELVSSARQLLGAIHTPFEEEGYIRPIHCRRYITYLKDICQKTQVACSFLDKDTSIPLVFYALRHKILPMLYFIKEHANTLIHHLEQYRLYPAHFSKTALRHEICESYQMLLSSLIEIEQQTQPLLDEALFQQLRLQTSRETTIMTPFVS